LALGFGLRKKGKRKKRKRQSTNSTEDTLTEIGSKWSKKKKRRSEERKTYPLEEKIEEDRSSRKIDRGQLSKQKKERQVGEARKTWVKEDLGFWI